VELADCRMKMNPRKPRRHIVGLAADIPAGTRVSVEIGGRRVAIFNVDGALYALRDACPHQGARLSEGTVALSVESETPGRYRLDTGKARIVCPWHGWEYDLQTGDSRHDRGTSRVKSYEVARLMGAGLSPACARPGSLGATRARASRGVDVTQEEEYVVVYI
jgi:3-phenylpropionate/trans-cinnamate dioxygenase ferredoxin subunit